MVPIRRRAFLATGGSALLGAGLSSCERVSEALMLHGDPNAPFAPAAAAEIDAVAHVLQRATFGVKPGDYETARQLGETPEAAAKAWLERQLKPEGIEEDWVCTHRIRRLELLALPAGEMFECKPEYLRAQMIDASIYRAALSERQLYEVMCEFWSDHFNIHPDKGDCRWMKAADDREVIRAHALGKFPDMVRASALSAAMLWYLDGRENRKESGGDKPNENYARELLELHTLGVHGGYTQDDVMEVARALTGWTVRPRKAFLRHGKVEFDPGRHDGGAKTVLGESIAAGMGANELDRVLEIVCRHPSTARYIAEKLCRRFIADQPPAEAVDAAAQAFADSGGDIKSTLRAVFGTESFWAARGTQFKRPFHFVMSALRASGAKIDETHGIALYLERMGHMPHGYPTPDGYPLEPEPWLGTLFWRWHFAAALGENRLGGVKVDWKALAKRAGGQDAAFAHLVGRTPNENELAAAHGHEKPAALALASPAFQFC